MADAPTILLPQPGAVCVFADPDDAAALRGVVAEVDDDTITLELPWGRARVPRAGAPAAVGSEAALPGEARGVVRGATPEVVECTTEWGSATARRDRIAACGVAPPGACVAWAGRPRL